MTTRKVDRQSFALGYAAAKRQMAAELFEMAARIDRELADLRDEVDGMRGDVARARQIDIALKTFNADRDGGVVLH